MGSGVGVRRKSVAAAVAVAAAAAALALAWPVRALVPLPPTEIAFVRTGDIWTMDREGNSQHAVAQTREGESDPCLSSDGDLVAFTRSGGVGTAGAHRNVWVRGIYDATERRLTMKTPGDDFAPSFSPDGRLIAFFSTRDHGGSEPMYAELYLMRADGTGQRRLTKGRWGLENPVAARWRPDGKVIAVWEAGTGGGQVVTLVDAATGRTSRAVPDKVLAARGYRGASVGGWDWNPADPDEVAIALYDLAGPEGSKLNGLFVVEPARWGFRVVATGPCGEPSWSFDGRRIAYTRWARMGDRSAVWMVDARGSGDRQVAEDAGQAFWKRPSPGAATGGGPSTSDTSGGGSTGGTGTLGGTGSGTGAGTARGLLSSCPCCGGGWLGGLTLAFAVLGVARRRFDPPTVR